VALDYAPQKGFQRTIDMTITEDMHQAILQIPDRVWDAAGRLILQRQIVILRRGGHGCETATAR
jgi:hypothetical protein